jgi:hypothetical protein
MPHSRSHTFGEKISLQGSMAAVENCVVRLSQIEGDLIAALLGFYRRFAGKSHHGNGKSGK